MSKLKNEWRSFHARLSDVATVDDCARVDALYRELDARFQELLADPRFMECAIANIGEYRTKFTKAMNASYGKPYLAWPVNNAAKYYRIMMTQVRDVMKGFIRRRQIASVCERFDWDCSGERMRQIQEAVHDESGKWVKYRDIANICQAGEMPSAPEAIAFEIDYSSEDDQISREIDADVDHVCYALRVGENNHWVSLTIQVPKSAREHYAHYARPNIIPIISDGDIIDYEVMISYEPKLQETPEDANGILGVDLGKLKAASMAALYPDGTVSCEHLVTKETQRLLEKLNRVYDETRASMDAIERCDRDDHRKTVQEQLDGQREKLSSLRAAFARLVARDICSCASSLGCSEVHLEDLARLIATGDQITGRWNFAAVKAAVIEACTLRGIRVSLVDPAYTSKTSPFDNSEVLPRQDRLVDCGGILLDRDYLGAINIARCESGRKCRSCLPIDLDENMVNLLSPAVSCKLESRKGMFK